MIIKTLRIKNILSIEDITVNFDDKGLVLLCGYNASTGRSNASGKTAIFNALSFALFDKVPRDISKTEILREGTSSGSASCDILVGDDTYTVTRRRPSGVSFLKNGLLIEKTQQEFESLLRLNYDQFLVTMYFAQGSYSSRFLSLNDREKKDFILTLMQLDKFDAYYDAIKNKIKSVDAEIASLNSSISSINSSIGILSKQTLDDNLLKDQILECRETINTLRHQKDLLSESIKKPDISKYDKIKDKLLEQKHKIIDAKSKVKSIDINILNLERMKQNTDIPHDIVCPSCNSEIYLHSGSSLNKSSIDKIVCDRVSKNKDLDDKISILNTEKSSFNIIIDKENEVNAFIDKIIKQQVKDESEYTKMITSSCSIDREIILNQDKIKLIQDSIDKISSIKKKISDLTFDLKIKSDSLSVKQADKDKLSAASVVFSATGAQAYIMEDFISSFNDFVYEHLSAVWNNASYMIRSYKDKKDNSISAKFSESLIIDSKNRSLGSLSGGEYRMLSLVVDFAVIDVLQKHFGMRLNPIILDEPFDGLDNVGKELIINLLQHIADSKEVWVVDHASEVKSLFSRTVTIEKKFGISKIAEDVV